MNAELQIVATNDNIPPEVIGDVRIRVVQGQTVNITRADLTNSTPDYYHEFDRPLGGIKIVGPGNRLENILMPGSGIIATLTNNNQFLYYIGDQVINGEVSRLNLDNNLFKVRGNSIGSDHIEYVANAHNSVSNTTSSYNDSPSKIHIDVVSGINRPPSQIGNNEIDCPIGVLVPININAFTFDTTPPYADPENDPPLKVIIPRIEGPAILTYNGVRIQNNQEFYATNLELGQLKSFYPPGTTEGTITIVKFDVADVGSGQYSGL